MKTAFLRPSDLLTFVVLTAVACVLARWVAVDFAVLVWAGSIALIAGIEAWSRRRQARRVRESRDFMRNHLEHSRAMAAMKAARD